MPHKAVIFDCDGVLIDSEVQYVDFETRYLAERGIRVDRDWYVSNFMALAQDLWRERFSALLEDHTGAAMTDDQYHDFKSRSRAQVMAAMATVPGVETVLTDLQDSGVPRAVASSTQMPLLPKKLSLTGLDRFFGEHVYSGDMVANGKPAPDLFLLAAEGIATAPADCLVIEDSVNGVRGGKAAGMMVAGFLGGGHVGAAHGAALREAGADMIFDDHAALAAWLAGD